MNLATIVYEPPRNGPTLWGIGVPHRLAAEFFVPDPYAKFKNPLVTGSSDKLVSNSTFKLILKIRFSYYTIN